MSELSLLQGRLSNAVSSFEKMSDDFNGMEGKFNQQIKFAYGFREYKPHVQLIEFNDYGIRKMMPTVSQFEANVLETELIPFVDPAATQNGVVPEVGNYSTDWIEFAMGNGRPSGFAAISLSSFFRYIGDPAAAGVRVDITYGGRLNHGGVLHTNESINSLFEKNKMSLDLGSNALEAFNTYRFNVSHPFPDEGIANAFFIRIRTVPINGVRRKLRDVLVSGSKINIYSVILFEVV